MAIYDQLGLVRPEIYRSRYGSEGIYRKGTPEEFHRYHTETIDSELNGEPVLIVNARAGTSIGETALYAAFLQQITGERIIVRSHYLEINTESIAPLPIPYMSDEEIAHRFEAIQGAGTLTETDQNVAARTALLIQTHFMKMILDDPAEIARETLQFDEEF